MKYGSGDSCSLDSSVAFSCSGAGADERLHGEGGGGNNEASEEDDDEAFTSSASTMRPTMRRTAVVSTLPGACCLCLVSAKSIEQ